MAGNIKSDVISENTPAAGVTADSVLLKDGTIKASGAESLKFYTYAHTITAGEDAAGNAELTITAVTLAKVRNISVCIYDTTGVDVVYDSSFSSVTANSYSAIYLINTTTAKVYFGTNIVENDVINITIIEAV